MWKKHSIAGIVAVVIAFTLSISGSQAYALDINGGLVGYYTYNRTTACVTLNEDILQNYAGAAFSTVSLGSTADAKKEVSGSSGVQCNQPGLIDRSFEYNFTGGNTAATFVDGTYGNGSHPFDFLHNGKTNWSINVWSNADINPTVSGTSWLITDWLSTDDNTGHYPSIDIQFDNSHNNYTEVIIYNATGQQVIGGVFYNVFYKDHKWHMYTYTYKPNATNNQLSFYLDGNLIGHANKTGNARSTGTAAAAYFSRETYSRLDETSYWNYALSTSDISTLYNNTHGYNLIYAAITSTTSKDPRLESSGEQRVTYFDGTKNWIFYYGSSNIFYRYTNDGGATFSRPSSTGSGPLAANSYFGVFGNGTNVMVSYANSTGVFTKKGIISDNSISWNLPVSVLPLLGTLGSGQQYFPSFEQVGSTLFLGFNVVANDGTNHGYVYQSSNLGNSWSLSTLLYAGELHPAIVGVAKYGTVKTIAVIAKYNGTEFNYTTFDGISWSAQNSTSGAGLTVGSKTNAFSITSNGTYAWVGYVANNTGGPLKSMRFCSGTSYSFPSTSITSTTKYPTISSIGNDIHLFFVNATNNVISRIINVGGNWSKVDNPFGTSFSNPAFLHAEKYGYEGHHVPMVWREGSASPFSVKFGVTNIVWDTGSVISSTTGMPTVPASGKQVEASVAVYQPNQNILVTGLTQLATTTINIDIYRSTDGASTWNNVTSVKKDPRLITAGDPVATVSKIGKFYLSYLNTNGSVSSPSDLWVASSDPSIQGSTWNFTQVVNATTLQDKPWIAADRSGNLTTQNNVYMCWTNYTSTSTAIDFLRIKPADYLTSKPQQLVSGDRLNNFVSGCNVAIGPQGQVFLSWMRYTSSSAGEIDLLRNYVAGSTGNWNMTVVKAGTFTRFTDCTAPDGSTYPCLNGHGGVKIKVNNFPSMDIDPNGSVHIAYATNGTSNNAVINYAEATTCSKNSCVFSNPININIDSNAINPHADHFEPALVASNETSPAIIHVTVNDRREDLKNEFWRPYDYHCHSNCNQANNWYNTIIIARNSTNYDLSNFIGDYHGLTSSIYRESIDNWNDHNSTATSTEYDVWGDRTRS